MLLGHTTEEPVITLITSVIGGIVLVIGQTMGKGKGARRKRRRSSFSLPRPTV